jgi:hypothetical protein
MDLICKKRSPTYHPVRNVVFFTVVSLVIVSCNERSARTDFVPDVQIEKKLDSLFIKREYFTLRDVTKNFKDKISPDKYSECI